MNTILTILQWAIPSGGIGAAIAWVANRRLRLINESKVAHDTYKLMYEDISELLKKTQKKYEETTEQIEELREEYARTRRSLNRLSRAVEAIQFCPYRADCPIRHELSIDADSTKDRHNDGKADGKTVSDKRRKPGKHRDNTDRAAEQPARLAAAVGGNNAAAGNDAGPHQQDGIGNPGDGAGCQAADRERDGKQRSHAARAGCEQNGDSKAT